MPKSDEVLDFFQVFSACSFPSLIPLRKKNTKQKTKTAAVSITLWLSFQLKIIINLDHIPFIRLPISLWSLTNTCKARSLWMPLKMEWVGRCGEGFLSSWILPKRSQTLMLQEGRPVTVPGSQLCPRNSKGGRSTHALSRHVHRLECRIWKCGHPSGERPDC